MNRRTPHTGRHRSAGRHRPRHRSRANTRNRLPLTIGALVLTLLAAPAYAASRVDTEHPAPTVTIHARGVATAKVGAPGPRQPPSRMRVTASAGVASPSGPTWPAGSTVRATGIAATLVRLAWTPAEGDPAVSGYRVYVNGRLHPGGEPQASASPTRTVVAPTYTVSGLKPGTRYTFYIEAGDRAGRWSTRGPSVTVRTAGS